MYKNVHSSTAYNSKSLETTLMPISEREDE